MIRSRNIIKVKVMCVLNTKKLTCVFANRCCVLLKLSSDWGTFKSVQTALVQVPMFWSCWRDLLLDVIKPNCILLVVLLGSFAIVLFFSYMMLHKNVAYTVMLLERLQVSSILSTKDQCSWEMEKRENSYKTLYIWMHPLQLQPQKVKFKGIKWPSRW